jgi:F0F1-type ATP synthase assembly protein I
VNVSFWNPFSLDKTVHTHANATKHKKGIDETVAVALCDLHFAVLWGLVLGWFFDLVSELRFFV